MCIRDRLKQVLEKQPGKEDLYSPDFVEAYQKDEDARRIIDTALSIEGLTRGEGCLLYTSLEYSFNGLGVEYAGRPLGGRIDRVDVDAEGRAMVIDYKHRADVNAFKLSDPTVAKRDGTVPADDPDWLPEHTPVSYTHLKAAVTVSRVSPISSRWGRSCV